MNETPLPLMVWAISAVGLPLVAAASANAVCSAADIVAVEFDRVPAESCATYRPAARHP